MKISHLVAATLTSLGVVGPVEMAQAANLFFEGDMVRGGSRDGSTWPTCVLTSQFTRQDLVAWRARVLDPNGQALDDKGLKSLEVQLSDGQAFVMKFGPHPRNPPQTDSF